MSNSLWAQHREKQNFAGERNQCTLPSQEEIEKINKNIVNILAENFAQRNGLPVDAEESKPKINYEWWASSIFTDNPKLRSSLIEKYKAYDEIRFNQNWKNSPYGNINPEEIDKEINNYLNSIRKSLKQNPIYKSNRLGSNCGKAGLILTDFAAFLALQEIALAALPAATTVTEFSAISGLAWDFTPLFGKPAFLQATSTVGRIGSFTVGFAASTSILNTLHSSINDLLGIQDETQTSLGAQKDLHTALKHAINLSDQIKEINADIDLTPLQKRKRINTRYKEAIVRIYALDYVNTYLAYGEKPEKYLWAILDLTTLLQNRGTVTFEGDYGKTIEIESVPRLIERTPQMQESLEKIMASIINGFKIKAYGKHLQNKVEKQALKNLENLDYNFDF